MIDYAGYWLLKLAGPVIRALPLEASLWFGRRVGEAISLFDPRHRRIVRQNLTRALGSKLTAQEISRCTWDFYRTFGENIIDIFLIPRINRQYIKDYVRVEGEEHVRQAFTKGKGVILLAVHAGSWELSNIICANFDFPFTMLVRSQRLPRLNGLLNSYRKKQGCKIFERETGLKHLIAALKNNESVGMTLDQGGRLGVLVPFFGRSASMAQGAVRLALKYGSAVIPVFFMRRGGPRITIFVDKEFELSRTADTERDVRDNVEKLTRVFEGYIERFPKEYFWSYRIWKYSDERDILILSDGRAGHLRQCEAVAEMTGGMLEAKGLKVKIGISEVSRIGQLDGLCADIIISCGSRAARFNRILSRRWGAKSIVIQKPSGLGLKGFDLAILPRHDNPPQRKNVVVTEGALSVVTSVQCPVSSVIGVLIGGDSKKFRLEKGLVGEVLGQVKAACENAHFKLMLTTSRRTSQEVETLIKGGLCGFSGLQSLVIANENNPADTVARILGASRIIITSAESISMISEAVNSGRYVVVFDASGLSRKHRVFLEHFSRSGYIRLCPASEVKKNIDEILRVSPPITLPKDTEVVRKALERLL